MSVNKSRYDLVAHGRVLATRPLGREVGRAAADRLADNGGLLLNFFEIDVASPSFLDEVVRALSAELRPEGQRWLLVAGTNEDVRESLELVLERHKMALAAVEGETLALVGGSSQLAETLTKAQEMGQFTAPDLARSLELKLPAVHQRLNALMAAGALRREVNLNAPGKRGEFNVIAAEGMAADASRAATETVEAVTL